MSGDIDGTADKIVTTIDRSAFLHSMRYIRMGAPTFFNYTGSSPVPGDRASVEYLLKL